MGVAAVAAIWYFGAQLIEAVNDYAHASDLAKMIFAAIGLATFIRLEMSRDEIAGIKILEENTSYG